jgi:hypothetical protein
MAMARGRNSPSSTLRAASGTNSPLEVIEDRKSGPRPSADLGGGALRDEPAVTHDAEVGAHLLNLGQQVARHEDRRPVRRERRNEVAHLASSLRVKAVRRLIEHEELPWDEERGGDRQPLAHPQGVGAVALPRGRQEADPVESGVDALLRVARVRGEVGRVETLEVCAARQVGVKGRTLDEGPDTGKHHLRTLRDRLPQKGARASGRSDKTEQHPDRRRLARAVRTEEAVHRPPRHDEVDAVDRGARAETLRQPPGRDREIASGD